MRRFEFTLERLLKLKRQRERLAEAQLAKARAEVDLARARAVELQTLLDDHARGLGATVGQAMTAGQWMPESEQSARLGRALLEAGRLVALAEARLSEAARQRAKLAAEAEAVCCCRALARPRRQSRARLRKWLASAHSSRASSSRRWVCWCSAPRPLGEIVRRHAHELLGREDLKKLVDKVRETSPAVVDELLPKLLTMGTLHRVLTLLLEERVPITHLPRIRKLANHAHAIKDVAELCERARTDVGRSICDRFRNDCGRLRALVLDPRLEVELRRAVHEKQLTLEPGRLEQPILRLASELRKASARGHDVALLCDTSLRRPLRHALARSLGDLSVVAYQEIPTDLLMETAAMIRPEDLGTAPPRPPPQPNRNPVSALEPRFLTGRSDL